MNSYQDLTRRPLARTLGAGTKWLAVSAACAVALTVSAFSAPAATAQAPLGTLLTVPLSTFGTIVAQNALRQNNVNLLQVTQTAVGDLNTQVATISVRQRNTLQPAHTVWLPRAALGWIKQANYNDTLVEQTAVGSGNQQIAQVDVSQENSADVPRGSRFLLCPLWAVPALQAVNQTNLNVVHVSQLAVGDNNSQVALVAVDQNNAAKLKVPTNVTGPLVQLNLNLNIITQVAVGNNNQQVAVVNVGQQNSI